jgi:Ca2+-binding RTX toxin-like protein
LSDDEYATFSLLSNGGNFDPALATGNNQASLAKVKAEVANIKTANPNLYNQLVQSGKSQAPVTSDLINTLQGAVSEPSIKAGLGKTLTTIAQHAAYIGLLGAGATALYEEFKSTEAKATELSNNGDTQGANQQYLNFVSSNLSEFGKQAGTAAALDGLAAAAGVALPGGLIGLGVAAAANAALENLFPETNQAIDDAVSGAVDGVYNAATSAYNSAFGTSPSSSQSTSGSPSSNGNSGPSDGSSPSSNAAGGRPASLFTTAGAAAGGGYYVRMPDGNYIEVPPGYTAVNSGGTVSIFPPGTQINAVDADGNALTPLSWGGNSVTALTTNSILTVPADPHATASNYVIGPAGKQSYNLSTNGISSINLTPNHQIIINYTNSPSSSNPSSSNTATAGNTGDGNTGTPGSGSAPGGSDPMPNQDQTPPSATTAAAGLDPESGLAYQILTAMGYPPSVLSDLGDHLSADGTLSFVAGNGSPISFNLDNFSNITRSPDGSLQINLTGLDTPNPGGGAAIVIAPQGGATTVLGSAAGDAVVPPGMAVSASDGGLSFTPSAGDDGSDNFGDVANAVDALVGQTAGFGTSGSSVDPLITITTADGSTLSFNASSVVSTGLDPDGNPVIALNGSDRDGNADTVTAGISGQGMTLSDATGGVVVPAGSSLSVQDGVSRYDFSAPPIGSVMAGTRSSFVSGLSAPSGGTGAGAAAGGGGAVEDAAGPAGSSTIFDAIDTGTGDTISFSFDPDTGTVSLISGTIDGQSLTGADLANSATAGQLLGDALGVLNGDAASAAQSSASDGFASGLGGTSGWEEGAGNGDAGSWWSDPDSQDLGDDGTGGGGGGSGGDTGAQWDAAAAIDASIAAEAAYQADMAAIDDASVAAAEAQYAELGATAAAEEVAQDDANATSVTDAAADAATGEDDGTASGAGYDGGGDDGGGDDGDYGDDGGDDGDGDGDPLVLRVRPGPVTVSSLLQSGAHFDFTGNGQVKATGWVAPGTGLLVFDRNGNGAVDNGTDLITSFGALSALDGNHDGVINAQDADFRDLMVWVTRTGAPGSGELLSLSDLGITAIGLTAQAETLEAGGNHVSAIATVTFADGSQEPIADVTFADRPAVAVTLDGRSAASLDLLDQVMAGAAPRAEGTAQAIATGLTGLIAGVRSADAALAADGPGAGLIAAAAAAARASGAAAIGALEVIAAAAQAVTAATGDQATGLAAAVQANLDAAAIGSSEDAAAVRAARTTQAAWLAAFTDLIKAGAALGPAEAVVLNQQATVLAGQAGGQYATAAAASEEADALSEQAKSIEALNTAAEVFPALLGAVATAWDVNAVTLVQTATPATAAGGDLLVLAPGAATVTGAAAASTYVVLPGTTVTINGFNPGGPGIAPSRLDFLGAAPGATIQPLAGGGVEITAGTSTVTLTGVTLGQLSLPGSLLGLDSLTIAAPGGVSASLGGDAAPVDDGLIQVSTLSAAGSGNTLIGGSHQDTLSVTGTGTGNVLIGGSGIETLQIAGTAGLSLHDTLIAGTGIDTLDVTGDADTLIGGGAGDTLAATGSNNSLIAGTGADTLAALSGSDNLLIGGAGDDVLEALGGGGNQLLAGTGDTTLTATGPGGDLLVGGDGYDLLQATGSNNLLQAGDGPWQSLMVTAAGTGNTLLGGAGTDQIAIDGGSGNLLLGGSGATTLEAAGTGNTLLAGSGQAMVWYADDGVAVDLGTGTARAAGAAAADRIGGVTIATASGRHDTLIAGATGDTLTAAGAQDTLIGGAGTDLLISDLTAPGSGGNLLIGSAGRTTALFQGVGLTVNMATGTAEAAGSNAADTLSGITRVAISGPEGTLIAGAPGEVLIGAGGTSTLIGNGGGDDLASSGGTTVVAYAADGATVDLATGVAGANGAAAHDTLTGITAAIGAGRADTLIAGAGDETLTAAGRQDTLIGGTGTTTLVSDGAGTVLIGGTGATTAWDAGDGVGASLATGTAGTGDHLTGIAAVTVSGRDDTITGGGGADTLTAAGQDDTLIGGTGPAWLTAAGTGDVVIAGTGATLLETTGHGNTLIGGSAATLMISDAGGNLLQAGTGATSVAYQDDGVIVDLGAGTAQSATSTLHDTLSGIDRVAAYGADATLIAGPGAGVITAAGSDDTLVGTGGGATLIGGDASAMAVYGVNGIAVDLGAGTAGKDTLIRIAQVTVTGTGDTINGSNEYGTIIAAGTADTLTGGNGTTTLVSDAKGNLLQAGAGDSSLDYAVDNVAVDLGAGTAGIAGQGLADRLVGFTTATVTGANDNPPKAAHPVSLSSLGLELFAA